MSSNTVSNSQAPRNRDNSKIPAPASGERTRKINHARVSRPAAPSDRSAVSPALIFRARAEARALLWQAGEFELQEAVDVLQASAEATGARRRDRPGRGAGDHRQGVRSCAVNRDDPWDDPQWQEAAREYHENHAQPHLQTTNGSTAKLPLANVNGSYRGKIGTARSPTPEIRLIPFNQIQLGTRRRDLVKGLIPRVGVTVLWGPPKCGKSFWGFDLLVHVALGWKYRERRVDQGPVIYCAFEGQTGIEARVAAFRQRFLSEHQGDIPFFLEPVTLNLVRDHRALIAAIKRQLGDKRPVAIALDTLNRSIQGSESSDEDMTAYIAAADALRDTFDCAVLIVHHCGVDGTRPRGHTSLTGAADAQLAVKRDAANNIIVTVEWMKDGAEGEIIASALEVETVGEDEDGQPITSCVIVPAKVPPASKSVPPKARLALNLLREALDDEGTLGRANSRVPNGVKTVPLSLWKSYFFKGDGTSSDKPDSKRKAFDRAVQKLQEVRAIGVWNDVVWTAWDS
jgi:AAA domain